MNGKIVNARKSHVCEFCAEPILPNDNYWRENITPWDHPENEGYFLLKVHQYCWKVWNEGAEDYFEHQFPDQGEWSAYLDECEADCHDPEIA